MFGKNKVKNGIHCTDLEEDGLLECEFFFSILQNWFNLLIKIYLTISKLICFLTYIFISKTWWKIFIIFYHIWLTI